MAGRIKSLRELVRHEGAIRTKCRCGRVRLFDPGELSRYFARRRWVQCWPDFAARLRCRKCGALGPEVSWEPSPAPPPDDEPPPASRSAKPPTKLRAPIGIDPLEWALASDDRVRRRLLRIVRG